MSGNKWVKDLDRFYDGDSEAFEKANQDTIKDKQEEEKEQKKDDLFPWGKFF
jgi:hypothetical protein